MHMYYVYHHLSLAKGCFVHVSRMHEQTLSLMPAYHEQMETPPVLDWEFPNGVATPFWGRCQRP